MYLRSIFVSSILLFTAGCNDTISLSDACKELGGFCEVIKADSNCRKDRESVIMTAYEIEKINSESADHPSLPHLRYKQLNNVEAFESCTYLQTFIEYKPAEERFAGAGKLPSGEFTPEVKEKMAEYTDNKKALKRDKLRTYREIKRYMSILEKSTKKSSDPHLLYWHWSRHQDENAINTLTHLYRQGKIKDYDLLFYIGTDMSRYDAKESKVLFLKSLESYPPEQYTSKNRVTSKKLKLNPSGDDDGRLHYDILRGLVQIYFTEENYDAAYVLARVLKLNNDRSADIDMIIEYMEKHNPSRLSSLDDLADDVDDQLSSGEFTIKSNTVLGK